MELQWQFSLELQWKLFDLQYEFYKFFHPHSFASLVVKVSGYFLS